jgi:hypothetical protein
MPEIIGECGSTIVSAEFGGPANVCIGLRCSALIIRPTSINHARVAVELRGDAADLADELEEIATAIFEAAQHLATWEDAHDERNTPD